MVDKSDKVDNTTSDGTGKDITNEVEVDESEVKLFTIEELVPSSVPITIPYMEVFRTNELEYVPYISPYNIGVSSGDSSEDSSNSTSVNDTSSDSNTNNESNNENNENNSNDNDS